MEIERLDFSYLTVKELKTVCKFFKVDIPPRAKRDQVEAIIILAQTQMAMATVEAFQYYMAEVGEEDGMKVLDISAVPLPS